MSDHPADDVPSDSDSSSTPRWRDRGYVRILQLVVGLIVVGAAVTATVDAFATVSARGVIISVPQLEVPLRPSRGYVADVDYRDHSGVAHTAHYFDVADDALPGDEVTVWYSRRDPANAWSGGRPMAFAVAGVAAFSGLWCTWSAVRALRRRR